MVGKVHTAGQLADRLSLGRSFLKKQASSALKDEVLFSAVIPAPDPGPSVDAMIAKFRAIDPELPAHEALAIVNQDLGGYGGRVQQRGALTLSTLLFSTVFVASLATGNLPLAAVSAPLSGASLGLTRKLGAPVAAAAAVMNAAEKEVKEGLKPPRQAGWWDIGDEA